MSNTHKAHIQLNRLNRIAKREPLKTPGHGELSTTTGSPRRLNADLDMLALNVQHVAGANHIQTSDVLHEVAKRLRGK